MKFRLLFIVAIALSAATSAMAHKSAKGIVKERMDLMESIAKEMKALKKIKGSEAKLDLQTIGAASAHIEDKSNKILPLFPKGSMDPPTEAKETIWKEWEKFSAEVEALSSAAKNLGTVATKSDFETSFKNLVQTCKSCHQDFRVKKDKKKHHH